jgi:drug/metabolite transporter (DMT)-like permease
VCVSSFSSCCWPQPGGSSFLLIKIGLEGLAPTQVVLARIGGGAVLLIGISVVDRSNLPRLGIVWGHAVVVAVLLCVVPFLCFAWAEQHISSGLASIYNATTPLITMLVATLALPEERSTPSRLTGLECDRFARVRFFTLPSSR